MPCVAFNIRVYIEVMRIIIDRGALIVIRKARMLQIWVLLKMGVLKKRCGSATERGRYDARAVRTTIDTVINTIATTTIFGI